MILFLKMLLAHLIGDFILQPANWVDDKNSKRLKSLKLYLHIGVHAFLLALLFEFDLQYWIGYVLIIASHFIIDFIKANLQRKKSAQRKIFFIDQLAHILIIIVVAYIYHPFEPDISKLLSYNNLLFITSLVIIIGVAPVIVQESMSKWNPEIIEGSSRSLEKAGHFIGILERLFVFVFIIAGRWEAIGFLLAAKSVFRFGDLKESKSRKLTEYILIGTLLSFGIAILTGLLYIKLSQKT